MATIDQIISNGFLSSPLAANYNAKAGLFNSGALATPKSPVLILMVTSALNWMNEGGNYTTQQMTQVANYLVWLCGKFGLIASNITGSGGSVIPITPGSGVVIPSTIDWIVSGTASATAPLADAEITVTFDGTGGMPDLRGYNMDFFRGGQIQYTTNPGDGSTYYSWNPVSGVFSLSVAAITGEQMRISPIG